MREFKALFQTIFKAVKQLQLYLGKKYFGVRDNKTAAGPASLSKPSPPLSKFCVSKIERREFMVDS